MNRKFCLIIIVVSAVIAAASAFAQQQRRPYNTVMKDIQSSFGTLRKNIEANNGAAVAEDAGKLEGYFAEIEAFWVPFNTKDAIGFAKQGRDAATAIATAVKANNDIKTTQKSVEAIQATCASCHRAHREQVAEGYIIKP